MGGGRGNEQLSGSEQLSKRAEIFRTILQSSTPGELAFLKTNVAATAQVAGVMLNLHPAAFLIHGPNNRSFESWIRNRWLANDEESGNAFDIVRVRDPYTGVDQTFLVNRAVFLTTVNANPRHFSHQDSYENAIQQYGRFLHLATGQPDAVLRAGLFAGIPEEDARAYAQNNSKYLEQILHPVQNRTLRIRNRREIREITNEEAEIIEAFARARRYGFKDTPYKDQRAHAARLERPVGRILRNAVGVDPAVTNYFTKTRLITAMHQTWFAKKDSKQAKQAAKRIRETFAKSGMEKICRDFGIEFGNIDL